MPINVFLSVGRPFTAEQEGVVASVEAHLAQHGLRARTVGRNMFTHKDPLPFVSGLMDQSAGALVIALERIAVEQGLERRGAPEQRAISNVAIATPWNQIEAAFAFAKGIPLLVIRERSVRADGLLERNYGWHVHATGFEPGFLTTPDFAGVFASWHRDVRKKAGWFGYRR